MTDLWVIVPSRGRPTAAEELRQAFLETCVGSVRLLFAVDDDDPSFDEYPTACGMAETVRCRSRNMVEALNQAVSHVPSIHDPSVPPFAVGFMGDDHRPRTVGWDREYVTALWDMGTGIVYGNDLFQGGRLPTQCAMTVDIVRALGYMAPPSLVHLAVDDWWLELGRSAGCIRYLPDVIVEHMHPVAGKAQWDAGYERVNAPVMYQQDLAEFQRLRSSELPAAIDVVRALTAVSGRV